MTTLICSTPFGEFQLSRWPPTPKKELRAWDQADLYLLKEASARGINGRVLIVNDSFGALCTALAELSPVAWSDSHLSQIALGQNLEVNGRTECSFVPSTQLPEGKFDWILARVPKSMTFWQHQLKQIRSLLSPEGTLLSAGMVKHLPKKNQALLESMVGPTERGLAVKKARCFYSRLNPEIRVTEVADKTLEFQSLKLHSLPNVFSKDKIDHGSQLLLSTLSSVGSPQRVLDLGCGNGLLGLCLQKESPKSKLVFLDESYQAVACARLNYESNCEGEAEFLVADGLEDYKGYKFDFIALNPPFHHQHQVGDHLAWRLIKSCRKHLLPGGELRLVGNRHLAYHSKLKRLFGNCELLVSDRRFVVLSAKISDE